MFELHLNAKRMRGTRVIALSIAGLILHVSSMAQTTYRDPKSRYELKVPDGWNVAPDEGVDQIIVRKGAVQAIVMVSQQNQTTAMTAAEAIDTTTKEFQGQCPTTRVRKSGTVTLAGTQGIYSLLTCSDPRSPAVAETAAVLTNDLVIVQFTMIAPLAQYYANLPVLDGIRDSLNVMGSKRASSPPGAETVSKLELERACAAGALTQEDCARRLGILLGQEARLDKAAPAVAAGNVYRDGMGRFSLQIPTGWNAKAEGDNGILGVQLRSGTDWINIMPAEPAGSASEVVLKQEQKVAAQSNSTRKPPFGPLGLVQLFGNGLEVTYDHFTASSTQGNTIETYIGGVGDITGTGHSFMLLIAALSSEQKDKGGAIFLSVAQSIQMKAH